MLRKENYLKCQVINFHACWINNIVLFVPYYFSRNIVLKLIVIVINFFSFSILSEHCFQNHNLWLSRVSILNEVGNNELERWKNPMVSLLDIVVGFAWSKDLEWYASGSVATGRAHHSGEVEGDDPDEYGYPGPPGWVQHEADTLIPLKKSWCWEKLKCLREDW
jgi:hypothetical protein